MSNAFMRLIIIVCCFFACLSQSLAQANDQGELLKVVALSRHGVRAPTQDSATLALWSQQNWPAWPVERGWLTPRGADLVTAMWNDLGAKLLRVNLLPEKFCPKPGSIFIRADTDERTRATAEAILQGLAPGCGLGYSVSQSRLDPLFHPVKSGLYRFDPIPAATDVLSMTGGGLAQLQENFSSALNLIGQISGSPADQFCEQFNLQPDCQLGDLPNWISISANGRDLKLEGSLGIASSLAEIFLLEYGQWPNSPAGWGRVNESVLKEILPLHSKIFDVVNRAPLIAWARGSALLTEITAALLGEHYDQRLNSASLVVFVGHDTNLANLGSLLGLDWQANGYPPNSIPPAAALFFELWKRNERLEVRVRLFVQPLESLHAPFTERLCELLPQEQSPGRQNTSRGHVLINQAEVQRHAPESARISAPPVVGLPRFELDSFVERVNKATAGAPLAPRDVPPLEFIR